MLIDGNVKINESCKDLIHQLRHLTKDEDGEEDKRLENDLCDATLYALMECKNYVGLKKVMPLDIRSAEYMETKYEKELEENLKAQDEENWWNSTM